MISENTRFSLKPKIRDWLCARECPKLSWVKSGPASREQLSVGCLIRLNPAKTSTVVLFCPAFGHTYPFVFPLTGLALDF